VLALSELNQSAPASRLTFKIKIKKAPEVRGAQTTELGKGCQVLRGNKNKATQYPFPIVSECRLL
jgi:hypothetical protein